MESAHDTKDWHISQSAMQSPSPVSVASHSQSLAHCSPGVPTMNHSYTSFPHGSPMHPPMNHYSPLTPNFMSPAKPESDPRLPGMMALSQPSTPRPTAALETSSSSPTIKKARDYSTSSFPSAPYPSMSRKRSRNDSHFSVESGPTFGPTKLYDNLFTMDRATMLTVRIHSKMDRGFFLADNDWTCYRRNYFQVSSAFSIHGVHHYYGDSEHQCLVKTDEVTFLPVHRFLIGISARVSNSDKHIELVQHTPKRDKGPQLTPEPKSVVPGGNLNMSSIGTSENIVTFERIQFKTATANNGKRRAAQQYYICFADLYAETDAGQIKVGTVQSAPLVVRGRSPGHYADSHERYATTLSEQPSPPQESPFPTGMMPSEYGSPYPYYPHFAQPMMMSSAPPTPSPPEHTPTSYTHHPPPPPSHAYMMHGDPHTHDRYHGEFHHPMQHPPSEDKLVPSHASHYQPHPPPTPNGVSHLHLQMNGPSSASGAPEWSRARYNSSNSSMGSPAADPHHHHGSYFSQSSASQASAFSPPTPTTPCGPRKGNSVPSMCNEQTS